MERTFSSVWILSSIALVWKQSQMPTPMLQSAHTASTTSGMVKQTRRVRQPLSATETKTQFQKISAYLFISFKCQFKTNCTTNTFLQGCLIRILHCIYCNLLIEYEELKITQPEQMQVQIRTTKLVYCKLKFCSERKEKQRRRGHLLLAS